MCLGFANTLAYRGSSPSESLHTFADLIKWCGDAGVTPSHLAQYLREWSEKHPKRVAEIFVEAIALREVVYRIFHAIASGAHPDDADLDLLNRAHRRRADAYNSHSRGRPFWMAGRGVEAFGKLDPRAGIMVRWLICSWAPSWRSFANARTRSACGFFWMIAKTARAVGVRCRLAAIAPKRIATTCDRRARESRSSQLDHVRARTRMNDGMKRARRSL